MELDRRNLLTLMAAAASAALAEAAPAAARVKWSAGSEPPVLRPPPGACDCHHYIYDTGYPVDRRGVSFPGSASLADYRALQRRLGITRQVIVQPSAYGLDNRVALDAREAAGPQARAVIVVDDTVSDVQLRRMHERGVRGIRFNFAPAGPTTPAMIEPLSRRIGDLGWHIEVNAWAAALPDLLPILARVPSPVVLDHLGHIPEPEGAHDRLFARIRRLIDNGRSWVKLAAPYDATKIGPPSYADSSALARAYVAAAPDRVVWGSNWPHPGEDPKPDDALLLDLLLAWIPEERTRHRILVDNPAELYAFPEIATVP